MDDKKTIKISTRYSLYIGILFLIEIVIVIVLVNFYMRRQALVEAESKAIEILDNRLAIHTYFSHQIKPNMFQFTENFRPKDYFDPTWMSSTYAVREMGKYANQLGNKDYYYKECAINARSPENEADDYEREFLKKLEVEAALDSHSSIRYFAGKPYFAVLRRGEAMEESCLSCHSDPQKAPKGLIDIYGPERSFHRKVGDVVQAISIRIPLSAAYASANRFSFELSGLLLVFFGLLFLVHYYGSRRWVFNPLDVLREKTWLIAHKKEHLGEKIDIPRGRELEDLAVAFNTLSENLRTYSDRLEDMVEKRTQQIKESEKRFRLLFENAPMGYQSLDENGRFIEVNQAWLDLFGSPREDVIGRSFGDFVHPDWQGHFKENFPPFKSIGEILGVEFEMVKRDGTLFTVSINGKIAKDENGRFLRTHCILTDITESNKAEKKLVALSSRQKAILSAVPDIIMEVDQNKIYTWANPAGFDFFGDDVIGKEAVDYFEGEQKIYQTVSPLFNGDESIIYVEGWQKRKDGQKRLLAWWCRVLKDSSGKVTGALSTARDITEQKQTEDKLRQFEQIVSTTTDMLALIDNNFVYLAANAAYLQALEKKSEEVIGRTMTDVFGEEVFNTDIRPRAERCLAGERARYQKWVEFPLTKRRCMDVAYTPFIGPDGEIRGFVDTARDITEQENLQALLIQAQKMESVGRLAGGVAHDYNNILSVVLGYTELALEKVDPNDPLHADLKEIFIAAKRSTDITRQLLAFARKQTIAPKVLDLNETLEAMLNMLRQLIGEDIDFAWLPKANLWLVKVDPSQLDQILANLCVNARDAIAGVGKITIETDKVTFDAAYCADHIGFIPGEFVMLAVSDNGCGMDQETLDNLFEPFFTTKGVGEGTGLGLATVYGIVKQNNGFINVYSEPEKGTTFKIYLPGHASEAREDGAENTSDILKGHGETVLLVEDEASILKLTNRILDGLGYNVLAARTTGKAIDLAKEHADNIQLLITDVVMPEMNGRDLANQLQSLNPDIKTLFMSGFTADVIVHRGVLDKGVNFIQKPFSRKDLAAKVRAVLDKTET